VYFTPHLMLPPKDASSTAGEPSSDPSETFFYIPLWLDLSLHALPAVILLFGASCSLSLSLSLSFSSFPS